MWLKELKKYIGLFVLGVALIAVYKTFDNFGDLLNWIGEFFALLTPFFIGFCIAYVLYVPCRKLEAFCQKTNLAPLVKHRRGIATATIYLVFFAFITLLMFAGRVGSMSVAMAITPDHPRPKLRNVSEKILIG